MSNSPKAVDRRPPMPLIYRILDEHRHRKAIQCLYDHAKTIDAECIDVAALGREINALKMAELTSNAIATHYDTRLRRLEDALEIVNKRHAMRIRKLEDALETIHRESADGDSRRIASLALGSGGD